MSPSRPAVTALVLAIAAVTAALGVTWAAESPAPHLERASSELLFDDVRLEPGVPVGRCTGVVPRGAGLVAVGFDGTATGALGPAVRIRVERGSPGSADPTDCSGFVPVETAYDGRLDALPPAAVPSTTPVAVERDQTVGYRATLTLPSPAAGSTRFALRITGHFADPPAVPSPGPPPTQRPADDVPQPCLQLQSGRRVERTSRGGGVRVSVRTPRTLPVQPVRPLPVYVTTRDGARPRMTAGDHAVRVRRTTGGRWVGHVPASALRRTPRVTVTVGRSTVTVPLRTRPCAPRVRAFLRAGGTVDLRVDTRLPLAGLRVTIPAALGRPTGGVLRVAAVDAHGVPRASRGGVAARGRSATSRLPSVVINGRGIDILDVPDGVRTLSLRLAVPGAGAARRTVCRRDLPVVGDIAVQGPAGLLRDPVRSALRPIGERCRPSG